MPRPSSQNPKTRLQVARERAGFTQENLARLSGVSRPTIQRLEHGTLSNPKIRVLTNLAIALDVPLKDIVEPEWTEWSALSPDAERPPTDEEREELRGRLPPGPFPAA